MKISIITVSQNSENTSISTLITALSQTYKDMKHKIIDGKKKPVTEFLENFEFIWKLRTDSLKQLIGLYESFINLILPKKNITRKNLKKLNIYSID